MRWLLLLLLCSPALANITCNDGAAGCTVTTTRQCSPGAGTTCNITVASTAAGSVGVMCEHVSSATVTLTASLGGTWVTVAGSHGTGTSIGTECAYNLNMTGAITSVTCTLSATAGTDECSYFNFSFSGSGITFDTSNLISDATCTTCSGVALTLGTANNYLLIQSSHCGQTCSAINQSYTGIFTTASNGMAYKINVTVAGTTPSWTQAPTGILAGGAIAIYETVGAGGSNVAGPSAVAGPSQVQ